MAKTRPILLVEDDSDTREALEAILTSEGFEIITASNGFEAIQKAAASESPCVIVLDDRMPLMSGQEFLAYRERHPRLAEIPVVFISGDLDTIEQMARRGAITFKKPFAIASFLESIREHCA
jgi:DNA-binding NtrC family response regulator